MQEVSASCFSSLVFVTVEIMFDHLLTCLEVFIINIEHILYKAYKSIKNHILNDLNNIRNKTDHTTNTFYKVILDIATA